MERRAEPFRYGDLVAFVDHKGRRRVHVLRPGGIFQAPSGGAVRHEAVVGQGEGRILQTTTGRPILCLRPTLDEYILHMPRRAQVIYPKDLGYILVRLDAGPGKRILEAGVGSGAMSLALLRAVGPQGQLISCERRADMAALARENVNRFFGHLPSWWRLEERDVYESLPPAELDAIFLDLPEPHRCVETAAQALRPGGVLAAWLPTTNQTQELVVALQRHPAWALVETVELLLRPWFVSRVSVRPDHRMVAHTGFLTVARRIEPPPGAPGELAPPGAIPDEGAEDAAGPWDQRQGAPPEDTLLST